MVFVRFMLLFLWMGILPICVGGIFTEKKNEDSNGIAFRFVSGTMLLWAIFQLVCVPCVIMQRSVTLVVTLYMPISIFCGVLGLALGRKKLCYGKNTKTRVEKMGWLSFGSLVAVQLLGAMFLAYADGDDSFYVAVSEIANDSNTMYRKSPYTIGVEELDVRHGLAPFPIWITFLARISGLHTAMVSHVVVGTYLIGLSYMVFYLVGRKLFEDRKQYLPLFLCFMALLVLFGDYSSRTPENFMIARSRQGKAAVGSIIIPMLVFLFLIILKRTQQQKAVGLRTWLLLASTITAACLCTTLGTFLSCAMAGCVGICTLLVYKRLWPVVKLALCCVPAVGFALLYFVMG